MNAAPADAPPLPAGWRVECLRALAILAAAALLALATNAFSDKPVPLLAPDGPGAPPERAPRISIDALKSALASQRALLLLDVRRPEIYAAAHPAGAKNAPAEEFLEAYTRLNLSTLLRAAEDVVLLCDSAQCPAADRVAKTLRTFKHDNVRVLQDGWVVYENSGLPVEKGVP